MVFFCFRPMWERSIQAWLGQMERSLSGIFLKGEIFLAKAYLPQSKLKCPVHKLLDCCGSVGLFYHLFVSSFLQWYVVTRSEFWFALVCLSSQILSCAGKHFFEHQYNKSVMWPLHVHNSAVCLLYSWVNMLDLLGHCTFQVTALNKAYCCWVITIIYYYSTTFQIRNDFPFEIFTVKDSCFIHNYGSIKP